MSFSSSATSRAELCAATRSTAQSRSRTAMPPHVTLQGDRVPIKLWARRDEVESQALEQLHAIAALPWVAHHVAVMPDVHLGKGATVGSVIAMRGAVCPAAVGVDIGCGMAAKIGRAHV